MTDILSGLYGNAQPQFWMSVVEIIWINVLLSGDNAIVIALACRDLEPRQRLVGMALGTVAALILRLVFAGLISTLMAIPYLKIAGGLALLWIAIKLVVPTNGHAEEAPTASKSLLRVVKIIAVADIVMSLDNVIAVVAAAKGNFALLVFGLGISIPAIVAGATVIMAILNRFPIIAWVGAAVLGWIAGDVIASDSVVADHAASLGPAIHEEIRWTCALLGAGGTLLAGTILRANQARQASANT
jgi:YjbE family integral membrane protein